MFPMNEQPRFLCQLYEENGLFARIIDSPAEEATKHSFHLKGVPRRVQDMAGEVLDALGWEDAAATAIKWARLFGGAVVVILADDGPDLAAPLDWGQVRSVDDLAVFDCSQAEPDNEAEPGAYRICSRHGTFIVHASRCLVFKNDPLPERSWNVARRFWGIPEYLRLHSALDDVERAQGSIVDLLDRSSLAIYRAKGLSETLATEQGEEAVDRRLMALDMCRGALGIVALDTEESFSYGFESANFSGVSGLVEISRLYLAAVSRIPEGVLFGSIGAGDKATLESWYSFVEGIQTTMLKGNLRYLLKIIFQAAVNRCELAEVPPLHVEFSSLWLSDELERAEAEHQRAEAQLRRASAAQTYVGMGALHPGELRSGARKWLFPLE